MTVITAIGNARAAITHAALFIALGAAESDGNNVSRSEFGLMSWDDWNPDSMSENTYAAESEHAHGTMSDDDLNVV